MGKESSLIFRNIISFSKIPLWVPGILDKDVDPLQCDACTRIAVTLAPGKGPHMCFDGIWLYRKNSGYRTFLPLRNDFRHSSGIVGIIWSDYQKNPVWSDALFWWKIGAYQSWRAEDRYTRSFFWVSVETRAVSILVTWKCFRLRSTHSPNCPKLGCFEERVELRNSNALAFQVFGKVAHKVNCLE